MIGITRKKNLGFTNYLFSHDNIIFTISLVGVFIQSLPFLLGFTEIDLSNTPIGEAVQSSQNLKMVHIASLATCLPIAVDILFDLFCSNKSVDWEYRPIFLISTALPSFLFTVFHASMTPIKYLAIYHFGLIMYEGIVHSILMKMDSNDTKTRTLTISYSFCVFCCWVKTLAVCYFTYWINAGRYLSLLGLLITAFMTIHYGSSGVYRNLFRFHKHLFQNDENLSDHEAVFTIYIVLFMALTLLILRTRIFYGNDFRNLTESYFVTVEIYFIVFGAFITVFPGRFARMKAEISQHVLNTKGTFVRYVSHEIRSPLNVVYAGLEMALKELAESNASKRVIDLISDIYDSAQGAINLLNDLLHYENMEARTFKLDLTWRGLLGLSKINMKSFSVLAEKNQVQMIVDDQIGLFRTNSNFRPCDIFPGMGLNDVALRVDACRIDQVVRNLLTNAMKFTPADGIVTVRSSVREGKLSQSASQSKSSSDSDTTDHPSSPLSAALLL